MKNQYYDKIEKEKNEILKLKMTQIKNDSKNFNSKSNSKSFIDENDNQTENDLNFTL